jgi:hypothetical protein
MFENADIKDPLFHHSNGWITYVSVFAISMWGGIVSYFGKREKFSWRNFFAHLMSSGFAGFLTFWACEASGITGPLLGVLCGVAAHMGTPAIIRLAKRSKFVKDILEGTK